MYLNRESGKLVSCWFLGHCFMFTSFSCIVDLLRLDSEGKHHLLQ